LLLNNQLFSGRFTFQVEGRFAGQENLKIEKSIIVAILNLSSPGRTSFLRLESGLFFMIIFNYTIILFTSNLTG